MTTPMSAMGMRKAKLAVATIFFSAAIAVAYFTLLAEDPREASGAVPQERTCEVVCKSCGVQYEMSLSDYLSACEARADEMQGIICRKCGKATAWLGEPPIEYSVRKWNGGWVGRDMLKSNLKAYHAAHPEPAGMGVGVEDH